ncbi:MAG: 30S ribosomal protein S16 [Chloroflexi bacterium]|nr:30S ribosomal protein S16 [Chloroflexota bacterium]
MLRIRLKRVGARNQPSYRIVVADARAARDGAFVEQVGHYNPMTDPPTIVVDEEKTLKWLRLGAQPSDSVVRLLRNLGTLDKIKNP